MNKSEIAILLSILDLENLKPIIVDHFQTFDRLDSENLIHIAIQNEDDHAKLKHALVELEHAKDSIEQYEPILTINGCNQFITRIENETNLISSCLNLLLNNSSTKLPTDDATCDIDNDLYNSTIKQIETDAEQLNNKTEELIKHIEKQYSPSKQSPNKDENKAQLFCVKAFAMLTLSILCITFMYSIKSK